MTILFGAYSEDTTANFAIVVRLEACLGNNILITVSFPCCFRMFITVRAKFIAVLALTPPSQTHKLVEHLSPR